MRTILSISQDESLLLSRAAVLRKTDAEVIAANAKEAKKILKTRRFDLVVLCYSLSPEDTLEIAELARHQAIAVPVLRVVSKTDSVSEWTSIAPDAAVSCDPRVLVEKVSELLNVSQLQASILISGNDPMLLTTRRIIFEKAGYAVFTTDSAADARLVLMNHRIDVLVLCQSLDDGDRASILEVARQLQPEIKCACLSYDERDVVMDRISGHCGLNGPPALLVAIGRMLQEKTALASSQLSEAI